MLQIKSENTKFLPLNLIRGRSFEFVLAFLTWILHDFFLLCFYFSTNFMNEIRNIKEEKWPLEISDLSMEKGATNFTIKWIFSMKLFFCTR